MVWGTDIVGKVQVLHNHAEILEGSLRLEPEKREKVIERVMVEQFTDQPPAGTAECVQSLSDTNLIICPQKNNKKT